MYIPCLAILQMLQEQLEVRRSYLDSEITAVEAELRLLELEAQSRVVVLDEQRQYFQQMLDGFQAAIDAKAYIQPIAIHYPHPSGIHPKAPFIGDTLITESILGLMSEHRLETTLHFLEPINS